MKHSPRLVIFGASAVAMVTAAIASCSSGTPAGPSADASLSGIDGAEARDGSPGDDGAEARDAKASDAISSDADVGEAGLAADDLGPFGSFCASYAGSLCERRRHCTSLPDPECEGSELATCVLAARVELGPAIAAGRLQYNAAEAARCFAVPADDFCTTNSFWALADCRRVFTGTVPNGGSCWAVDYPFPVGECAAGTWCAGSSESATPCVAGTCRPFLSPGARCADDAGTRLDPGCGPDGHCNGVSRVCVAAGAPGDHCDNLAEPCRDLFPSVVCAAAADGGATTECTLRRPAGARCAGPGLFDVGSACASLRCENGFCADRNDAGAITCIEPGPVCPTGTVCQYDVASLPACLPFREAGAPCNAGQAGCPDGFFYSVGPDAATACAPLPVSGAPCDGACAAGLRCSPFGDAGRKCAPVVALGGTCRGAGDDACAAGLRCDGPTRLCVKPTQLGAGCHADDECQPGLYWYPFDETRT